MNLDLRQFIKDAVSSVCRTAEFIECMIVGENLVINVANATLSIVPIGVDTTRYIAFQYDPKKIMEDDKFSFLSPYTEDGSLDLNKSNIRHKLTMMWNQYSLLSNGCEIVAHIPDLRLDPIFEQLISLKSAEGSKFYNIPGNNLYENFKIPIFTGFPTLNKGDSIGLTVKRIDHSTLLNEFYISKKKIKRDFIMYFRTLDIDRNLMDERFTVY